ncbi:MAG TPA: cation:proton antiporter [Planctomycetota bacterium]
MPRAAAWIDALAESPLDGLLLSLGLVLAIGTIAGVLARMLRLPALTGYLATGVGFHYLPQLFGDGTPPWSGHFEILSRPVNDFAMALVLFVLGGHFRIDRFRPIARGMFAIVVIESLLTFTLVTLAVLPAIGDGAAAVLLGVLAVAVAPATTLSVVREYRAAGPLSESLLLLTALSNLVAVFAFEIALLVLASMQGGEAAAGPLPIAWDLAGSLLAGLVAGYALIELQKRIGPRNPSLPLAAILLLTIGVCELADVPHMLAFLVTGAVVANRSNFFDPIEVSMETFAQPAYVAFFVLGGWHLDIQVFVASGVTIALYVLARTIGKIVGTRMGMRIGGITLGATAQPGLGLLCQAGAAIALAGVVGQRYSGELSELLLSVILGAVLVFELVGPLLLRYALVGSGEVPMSQLITHAPRDSATGWRVLLRRRARTLWRGRDGSIAELPVERVMRSSRATLPADAGMDEVLRFANHSPFNALPVVEHGQRLVGVIAVADLDEFAYDPKVARLVVAADLAGWSPGEAAVPAAATVAEVAVFFQNFRGNTAVVIDSVESGRFLGMVERTEILRLMRHAHRRAERAYRVRSGDLHPPAQEPESSPDRESP